jgi:DNA-binding CsgD family transcriptional regulator
VSARVIANKKERPEGRPFYLQRRLVAPQGGSISSGRCESGIRFLFLIVARYSQRGESPRRSAMRRLVELLRSCSIPALGKMLFAIAHRVRSVWRWANRTLSFVRVYVLVRASTAVLFFYFTSEAANTLPGPHHMPAASTLRKRLTPRERQLLQLFAEGNTSKEAAACLGISVKTAETHRANIMRKLELHSISDLIRYAIKNKIVEP